MRKKEIGKKKKKIKSGLLNDKKKKKKVGAGGPYPDTNPQILGG